LAVAEGEGRVFLRVLSSETHGLGEFRRHQRGADRVRRAGTVVDYARIADKPSRWDFAAGDLLYVPQNTVHQPVNDGDEPLLFLSAQNRLFKQLGYDNVVYVEDASTGRQKAAATA
jgi:gentisate 1,2-dioxygenase